MSARIRSIGCHVGVVLLLQACAAHAQSTPARIVSLAPSVTEVLFELGLGPRVVGVTSYCRYPAAARTLPKIGGYLTPSYEALVALRADLAVALPEHADIESRLTALRIPMLRLDHRSVDGIVHGIALLGERCGVQGPAGVLVRELRQRLARVRNETSRTPRPRVLLCFGRTDDFRRIYGSAPGTIYDDLVRYAGGLNALPAGGPSYPTLSLEGVMRLDPDVLVEFAPGQPDPDALVREWHVLGSLRAVKTGRVHVFTHDFLSVPGPRLVRFVEALARAIHPVRARS